MYTFCLKLIKKPNSLCNNQLPIYLEQSDEIVYTFLYVHNRN